VSAGRAQGLPGGQVCVVGDLALDVRDDDCFEDRVSGRCSVMELALNIRGRRLASWPSSGDPLATEPTSLALPPVPLSPPKDSSDR
jgi:hypothetical protein